MQDGRLARAPRQVSVSQLLISGIIGESDIRNDGTLCEISRLSAEKTYDKLTHKLEEKKTVPRRSRNENKVDISCCVCLYKSRKYAFSPCFHFCVCETCMLNLRNCPLCRQDIKNIHRIWI